LARRRLAFQLISIATTLVALLALAWPVFAQEAPNAGARSAQIGPTATIVQPAQPVRIATPAAAPTAAPVTQPAVLPAVAPSPAPVVENSSDFEPFWVAAYTATTFWTGASDEAESLGSAPVGVPLQVLQPQQGARLYVTNSLTQNDAWIDALAVGPIAAPTDQELADLLDPPVPAFQVFWVMTDRPAIAWSSPASDASAWGRIPQWRYLQVIQPPEGSRALTVDPRTNGYGWIDLDSLGPVGPPPPDYFEGPPPDDQTLALPGRIVGNVDLYEKPDRANYFSLDRVNTNTPVTVQGELIDADGTRWYHLDAGSYVPAQSVRTPDLPSRTFTGRWIDANLTEPVMVTAYEGDRPVYAALAVKGTTANQTPTGIFQILRRVADETMNSETIFPAIPRNAPGGYYLEHVLNTQYFTGDGASLHYNYWYANWGYAGSHGCLGMNLADSEFFWNFAGVGTTIYIHN
jgi:hypothetical protein